MIDPEVTVSDLCSALSACCERIASVDSELAVLCESRIALQRKQAQQLLPVPPQLAALQSDALLINTTVQHSALSANSLSEKIRRLDTQQFNVAQALQATKTAIQQRQSIQQCEAACQAKEWKKACQVIDQALHQRQNQTPINSIAASASDSTPTATVELPDPASQHLEELKRQLQQKVSSLIEEAIARGTQTDESDRQVCQLCELMPLIELTHKGLAVQVQIITQQMRRRLEKQHLTLASMPANSLVVHTEVISAQCDALGECLQHQVPHMRIVFGAGTDCVLIHAIHQLTDECMPELLDDFACKRQIKEKVKRIKSNQQQHSSVGAKSRVGLRNNVPTSSNQSNAGTSTNAQTGEDVDFDLRSQLQLLDEVCYVAREAEVFDVNLRALHAQAKALIKRQVHKQQQQQQQSENKTHTASSNALQDSNHNKTQSNDESSDASAHTSVIVDLPLVLATLEQSPLTSGLQLTTTSRLNESTQELLGAYIVLEEHFMLTSLNKAISMQEHSGSQQAAAQIAAAASSSQFNEEDEDGATSSRRDAANAQQGRSAIEKLTQVSAHVTSNLTNMSSALTSTSTSIQLSPGLTPMTIGISPAFLSRFANSLTSTLVDDTFYLLQQSCERALSLAHIGTVCACLNHVKTMLSQRYARKVIQDSIAQYKLKYASATTNSSISAMINNVSSSARLEFHHMKLSDDARLLVTLNDCEMSCSNTQTLRVHLERQVATVFAHQKNSHQGALLRHCLEELDEVQQQLRKHQEEGVQLVAQLLQHRLAQPLHVFAQHNFDIKEAEYLQQEQQQSLTQSNAAFANSSTSNSTNSQSFVVLLCDTMSRDVLPLRRCLTPRNYLLLLSQVLTDLVQRLESLLLPKRFSFWGGLQIDSSIRRLSHFCTQNAPPELAVRDKFTRLVQIGSILQLEKCDEMVEFYSSALASGGWRLYEEEVRRVLACRIEFAQRDIAQLQL